MFCPRCKIDVFGGSICHICASKLVPDREGRIPPKIDHSLDVLIGKGRRKRRKVKSDLSQSLPGRFIRIIIEIAIFCALFVGVTFLFMQASDWLSDQMQSKLWRFNPVVEGVVRNPVKYFWYVCCVIITGLTIKFRWHSDV